MQFIFFVEEIRPIQGIHGREARFVLQLKVRDGILLPRETIAQKGIHLKRVIKRVTNVVCQIRENSKTYKSTMLSPTIYNTHETILVSLTTLCPLLTYHLFSQFYFHQTLFDTSTDSYRNERQVEITFKLSKKQNKKEWKQKTLLSLVLTSVAQ